jgi:hypothetical protein
MYVMSNSNVPKLVIVNENGVAKHHATSSLFGDPRHIAISNATGDIFVVNGGGGIS